MRRSLIKTNLLQWEANPELPEDHQSLIDRFVKLRTISEVRRFPAWHKV